VPRPTFVPDTFRSLYREHFQYVFHSLRRLGARESDLEDLAHEVFLTLHRRLADYDRSRPMRPWLFGITYRIAKDNKRLSRHHHEVGGLPFEASDGARTPEGRLEEEQTRQLVIAALSHLEIERRAVLVMHDLDGEKMPDIAEALGIPLNTAYSRLRLARRDFEAAIRRIDPNVDGLEAGRE
jgi:RNA polymerase sigma-70 factor (ECF subfamily)